MDTGHVVIMAGLWCSSIIHYTLKKDSKSFKVRCIKPSFLVLFAALSGVVAGSGGAGAGSPGEEKAAPVQALPSPYSKITAPRKPHRCSSGHASDNRYKLAGLSGGL